MFYWRITKYNPLHRNGNHYLKNEWTSYLDIGKIFEKNIFTLEEYLYTENNYIQAVFLFMDCLKIDYLKIKDLENSTQNLKKIINNHPIGTIDVLANNKKVSTDLLTLIMQLILREKIWCKLEAKEMYVHFGWDYYMYIGSAKSCTSTIKKIESLGLYVEKYESPYYTK